MKPWVKYVRILTNLILFFIAVFLIIFLVPKILVFFLPFVIGWIIAMIANPLVRFLEKHIKIMRKVSSIIIIVLVLALICLGGYALINWLISQVAGLIRNLPVYYKGFMEEVEQVIDSLDILVQRMPKAVQSSLKDFGENSVAMLQNWVKNMGKPAMSVAGNAAKNVPSLFVGFFVALLSAYFFTADHDKLIEKCKNVAPPSLQRTMKIIKESFSSTVGGYFKAQFKIMGVVAIILMIGFLIFGVDYAILLGIVVAFVDMLPFLGTGTVLFPWALFEVLDKNYQMAIGLVVLYAVTQIVRQIIQPKLIGDSIGLAPLPTLVFIYIGYQMGGLFGMLIAIPAGMIIVELYRKGLFEGVLSDIKEIAEDINRFRKRPERQKKD